MNVEEKLYDLYVFWVSKFNTHSQDDNELDEWLNSQVIYEPNGVLQINKYD